MQVFFSGERKISPVGAGEVSREWRRLGPTLGLSRPPVAINTVP